MHHSVRPSILAVHYFSEARGGKVLRYPLHRILPETTVVTHSSWILKHDQLKLWISFNPPVLGLLLVFLPIISYCNIPFYDRHKVWNSWGSSTSRLHWPPPQYTAGNYFFSTLRTRPEILEKRASWVDQPNLERMKSRVVLAELTLRMIRQTKCRVPFFPAC